MAEKDDYFVSYDLTSAYYYVSLHPDSRRFVGFERILRQILLKYNCNSFGLFTAPWVFSKIIRELVMYRRAKGIIILLILLKGRTYLDELLFRLMGFDACRRMARMVEEDMCLVGRTIN
jgi:hypothetical protein